MYLAVNTLIRPGSSQIRAARLRNWFQWYMVVLALAESQSYPKEIQCLTKFLITQGTPIVYASIIGRLISTDATLQNGQRDWPQFSKLARSATLQIPSCPIRVLLAAVTS